MRNNPLFLFVIFLMLSSHIVFSQTHEADSLRKLLSGPADTTHFSAYRRMCWIFLNMGSYDSAQAWADRYYEAGNDLASDRFRAEARYMKGIAFARRGGFDPEAVQVQTEAMSLYENNGDLSGQGYANLMIGYVYYNQKNYPVAQSYWIKSRDFFLKAQNDLGLANSYLNLGAIEAANGNYNGAQNLYLQALSIFRAQRRFTGIAASLDELSALKLKEYEITDDTLRKLQIADSVFAFIDEELQMRRKNGDRNGLVSTWNSLANYYVTIGNSSLALIYADSSLTGARSIGSKGDIRNTYATLAKIYEQQNNYAVALSYQKQWAALDDSLRGADAAGKTSSVIAAYEEERRRKQEEYDKKVTRLVMVAVGGGLVLTIALVVVMFRAYRKSRKYSAMLADQNKIISQKNADITDSIQYSKRIQLSLLPDEKQVSEVLGDAFVFYRPKDIISGDFYWLQERNGKVFFMAADCTGHGVPGALMSMISSTLLNESVIEKNLSDPGQILDDVRSGIIRSLRQHEEGNDELSTRDGMDGALCVYNNATRELLYAGANNPLWIFRNNVLMEIKADKFPVGVSGAGLKPFTTHRVSLQQGDMLYVFTDGYADQFGGEHGKKLKYSGLRKLLAGTCTMPVREQVTAIDDYFKKWKGVHEQVDDVCMIGVNIR